MAQRSSQSSDPSTSNAGSSANYTTGSTYRDSSGTSLSSRTSLKSLRDSLPENPHIYDFSEICQATNNFLAKRYSSSSSASSWRCSLRGKDVIVFQRKLGTPLETEPLRQRLAVICRSHHMSVIKLLGASISGDHIFLVYDFVNGSNLADCLRNPKSPSFTVLSTWISRMQIATDLAHGLDYIHNNTGNLSRVHNHIKSSSVIVTDPSFNAKICHFGTAELCGEIVEIPEAGKSKGKTTGEITEVAESNLSKSTKLDRTYSDARQFKGTPGYMSPEFQSTGIATRQSDVFAFGVVILELLSGEEPLRYRYDKETGEYRRISVIEKARAAAEGRTAETGDQEWDREGRLRRWVDRRLRDSFPVAVAENLIRVALSCVEVDPAKRPDMRRVAGKISKLYLDSRIWSEKMKIPTDFSVSMAPR